MRVSPLLGCSEYLVTILPRRCVLPPIHEEKHPSINRRHVLQGVWIIIKDMMVLHHMNTTLYAAMFRILFPRKAPPPPPPDPTCPPTYDMPSLRALVSDLPPSAPPLTTDAFPCMLAALRANLRHERALLGHKLGGYTSPEVTSPRSPVMNRSFSNNLPTVSFTAVGGSPGHDLLFDRGLSGDFEGEGGQGATSANCTTVRFLLSMLGKDKEFREACCREGIVEMLVTPLSFSLSHTHSISYFQPPSPPPPPLSLSSSLPPSFSASLFILSTCFIYP